MTTMSLREVSKKSGTNVIPPAILENPFSIPAFLLVVLIFIIGAAGSRRRYVADRLDGIRIGKA